MYGLAMFGLLNVLLPLVFGMSHLDGLVVAAAATPAAVALLSFSLKSVMAPQGMVLMVGVTVGLLLVVWFGRILVPPAPLAMPETTVGHGTLAGYECLPPSKHVIRESQLEGLRCGSWLEEPGGLKEEVVHVWKKGDTEIARIVPDRVPCDGDGVVFRSYLPAAKMPDSIRGRWSCVTMTKGGQLVGLRIFRIIAADAPGGGIHTEVPDDAGLSRDGGVDAAAPHDAR
jgi:hypothetical protein